jgi:tetratricopeptide (TPR) repeat protein
MPLDPADTFAQRVESLFHEALEIPADSRAALLAECGDDEPLRRAVRRLLEASARAESKPLWSEPAIQNEARFAAADVDIGGETRLDRYRLMETIGAGGMGLVYKAVRADDEFSKLVAIKVVQPGAGAGRNEEIVRRFRQERQILAGLEHPHIARLLDGGSTPDGLPFLVMEYVDGVPFDRYLAERKPSLRETLELFREVCSAVSYAHRSLIVHRDLKPGNILVKADGTLKLLDFGIAKLLNGTAERTRTGAGALTPEYASPEQVRGLAVTTAADIYSLGVLLWESLAGMRLYGNTGSALDLAQAICTEPAGRLSARTGRHFDEDLENIVQMALRKEPERRYASVEQFSEDIRRYLEGYPVAARPATRKYLARRFVGRNKTYVAAAALLVLTLVAGIVATAREARIANRRFNDVRKLANSYLFEFHDAIRDLPGSTPARSLVAKRALEYLDSLAGERGNDPGLRRELGSAYERVGSVQGARDNPSLGDGPGALASWRKALAIRESLAAAAPRNAEIGVELSKNYDLIGDTLAYDGDLKGAAAVERKAVVLMERLAAAQPTSYPVRDALALAYTHLGNVAGNNERPNLGDARGAMELFQKVRVIREKLIAEDPANREQRLALSGTWSRIGAIRQALDDKEGSVAAYREAIAQDERLMHDEPLNVLYRREAAVDNRSVALILIRTGDLGEAQKCGDRSAQLFERLAKDDPANMEAQDALGDSYYSQGYLRAKLNDTAGALGYYRSAMRVYEAEVAKDPDKIPGGLRTLYQLMAELGIGTKDTGLALRSAQKELELDGRYLKADADNASAQRNQGVAWEQIGRVHQLLATGWAGHAGAGRVEWREARAWYRRSLDLWLDLQKKGTLIPMYVVKLEDARKNVARCDAALGS